MKPGATAHVRDLYTQCTYDYFSDRAVTVRLSEAAMKDLFGRILLPPQEQRREHQRGSFEHLGHIDRGSQSLPLRARTEC